MSGVSEKTEVVVEEFDVDEPIVEAPKEEVSNENETKSLSRKSNRELIEEASKQVEAESADGDKDEITEEPAEKDYSKELNKQRERVEKAPKKEVEEKEDFRPPNRFKVENKQLFNKLPPQLKQELSRTVKDLEGQFTRTEQQYKAAINEASGLLEVIKPFATNLAERGFSVPQGIAQLLAVQTKLTNPQTKDETYLKLGLDVQPSEKAWRQLGQHLGYSSNSGESEEVGADISNHPVIKRLEAENKALRDAITPLHTERQQSSEKVFRETVESITAELESVVDETDNRGTYLYPKLHDDSEFIERWKPLVSALVRALPGLSYADAGRRAYQQLEIDQTGNSAQAFQSKLPARNGNNVNERARSAAMSVRGRSAPPNNGFQIPDKIPRNNRDLVRLAHEMAGRDN